MEGIAGGIDGWIPGNLLIKPKTHFIDASEQYLLNTFHAFGNEIGPFNTYAKEIFEAFPYADLTVSRSKHYFGGATGGFLIHGDGVNQRFVVNMITQRVMEIKPFMSNDQHIHRIGYFEQALKKVYQIKEIESIALGENIGAVAAFGKQCEVWSKYMEIIERLAKGFPRVKTVLYSADKIYKKVKATPLTTNNGVAQATSNIIKNGSS